MVEFCWTLRVRQGEVEVNLLANLPSTIRGGLDVMRYLPSLRTEKTSEAEAVYYDEHMHLHLPFHGEHSSGGLIPIENEL